MDAPPGLGNISDQVRTMLQHTISVPEVTSGLGYGFLYSSYLHSVTWILRKAVHSMSGTGDLFDHVITVDTPGIGNGSVDVSICVPRIVTGRPNSAISLILIAEGGGFVLGEPTDGEHIARATSDQV